MTFACTAVRGYGIEAEEVVSKRYQQHLILTITAANTDVDLDIGDYTGTFWTAAGGSAAGLVALKAVKDIQIAALSFIGLGGTSLQGKVQEPADGSVSAAGYYQVSMNSTNTQLPELLFTSGNAPTAYNLELLWVLKDQQMPIQANVVP